MLEESAHVFCPYCGEPIDLQVDVSAGAQSCIEDCPVCCQPMDVDVAVDESGGARVHVSRQDA